jgi:UMF1 family MFS transporter
MLLVDVERGRTEGAALAKTLAQLACVNDALDDLDAQDTLSEEIRNDLRDSFSYQRGGRDEL